MKDVIQMALKELDELPRTVLALSLMEDMSTAEIGCVLDISEEDAAGLLAEAQTQLRTLINSRQRKEVYI